MRFWFDPQGELYVVCDEAQLEESRCRFLKTVLGSSRPVDVSESMADCRRWNGSWTHWMEPACPAYEEREAASKRQSPIQWEGRLLPASA